MIERKAKVRWGLLTDDKAISDNDGGQWNRERNRTDSNGNDDTAKKSDPSKRESLHHWTAYQAEAARDRAI